MKTVYESQYQRMTQQPIPSLVMRMAGPAVISMVVSTVYSMVDTFFVAQLGTQAVAAVGVTFAIS